MKLFRNRMDSGIQYPRRVGIHRLIGINITAKNVEPVYVPILHFDAVEGGFILELSWNSPFFLLAVSRHLPFPWFEVKFLDGEMILRDAEEA